MVKVKICANKSIEDAKMCIEAGADVIGILVGQEHNSKDFVSKEVAKDIADYAKNKCDISLVTHLTSAKDIIGLTKYIGNNIIQLHSNIEENEVEKIKEELPNVKLVRLIHISSEGKICTDYKKMKYADFYLLDSFNLKTNQVGGTGITHDWEKSRELIELLDKPTFLAGGLNPDNVAKAIEIAKPYGVDVNSGCKNEKGVKDKEKVKKFVKNSKSVNIKMGEKMLDVVEITIEEFRENIYINFLKLFPKEEQRSYKKIETTYKNGIEKIYKIVIDKTIIGFFMLEKLQNHPFYIDYFAIYKDYQNKGFGTEALKILIEKYGNKDGIIAEIEQVDEKNELTARRYEFYNRLGFRRFESEYLLYDVFFTPIVYSKCKRINKEKYNKIFFEYYKMNIGEELVKEKCKIIK